MLAPHSNLMGRVNRQNLSKSIILHHNKMSSLLSTVGRYGYDVAKNTVDEESQEDENEANLLKDDDEDYVHHKNNYDTVESTNIKPSTSYL